VREKIQGNILQMLDNFYNVLTQGVPKNDTIAKKEVILAEKPKANFKLKKTIKFSMNIS